MTPADPATNPDKETPMNAIPTPTKTRTNVVIWSDHYHYWVREHFRYVSRDGRVSIDPTFSFRTLVPEELDSLELQALRSDDQELLAAIANARANTVAEADKWHP